MSRSRFSPASTAAGIRCAGRNGSDAELSTHRDHGSRSSCSLDSLESEHVPVTRHSVANRMAAYQVNRERKGGELRGRRFRKMASSYAAAGEPPHLCSYAPRFIAFGGQIAFLRPIVLAAINKAEKAGKNKAPSRTDGMLRRKVKVDAASIAADTIAKPTRCTAVCCRSDPSQARLYA